MKWIEALLNMDECKYYSPGLSQPRNIILDVSLFPSYSLISIFQSFSSHNWERALKYSAHEKKKERNSYIQEYVTWNLWNRLMRYWFSRRIAFTGTVREDMKYQRTIPNDFHWCIFEGWFVFIKFIDQSNVFRINVHLIFHWKIKQYRLDIHRGGRTESSSLKTYSPCSWI